MGGYVFKQTGNFDNHRYQVAQVDDKVKENGETTSTSKKIN